MKWLLRIPALAIVLLGAALILVPAIQKKRLDRRVRSMVLEVQEGLQGYHVREEEYPKRAMQGRELVDLLIRANFLNPDIKNPWSGGAYQSDSSDDWLRYHSDSMGEIYDLSVLIPGTDQVAFHLDSTEHQSLEEE